MSVDYAQFESKQYATELRTLVGRAVIGSLGAQQLMFDTKVCVGKHGHLVVDTSRQ